MARRILDLDTLADRLTIGLNNNEYWLVTPDIMPVLDNRQFLKLAMRQDELASKPDLTDDEQQEVRRLTSEMCHLVLEAPDDVHASLTDRQRMLVIATAYSTFQSGLRMTAPMPAAPASSPASQTGTISSPA